MSGAYPAFVLRIEPVPVSPLRASIGAKGRPRLLDLFCCAGGAAVGYHRAGFDVVGVDIKPQPNYPFTFVQADCMALDLDWVRSFDAIHASPPCQAYSVTRKIRDSGDKHPDLVEPTRATLKASGLPYIIENVVGAPLVDPITLCGTMFGLKVFRHRLFECSFFVLTPPHQTHDGSTGSSRGYSTNESGRNGYICVAGNNFVREHGAAAMGIDWKTTRPELAQAIPPAYTEWLGKRLLLEVRANHRRAA